MITSVCQAEMSVKAVQFQSREPPTTTGGSVISRKNHPGPTLENITISEENQETASKLSQSAL